jgi:hypothetical protein
MATASFPSTEAPALPSISVDLPEGWQQRTAPDMLLAVIEDRGPDAFSPNVVVGVTRQPAGHPLQAAQQAADEFVQGLREVALLERADVELGGRPWSIIEYAHVTDVAGTIAQVVAVTVVDNGPVTDMVRVTGTVLAERIEQDLPAVREVIASTRVVEAS